VLGSSLADMGRLTAPIHSRATALTAAAANIAAAQGAVAALLQHLDTSRRVRGGARARECADAGAAAEAEASCAERLYRVGSMTQRAHTPQHARTRAVITQVQPVLEAGPGGLGGLGGLGGRQHHAPAHLAAGAAAAAAAAGGGGGGGGGGADDAHLPPALAAFLDALGELEASNAFLASHADLAAARAALEHSQVRRALWVGGARRTRAGGGQRRALPCARHVQLVCGRH
jgi:hypothetical protein